MPRTALKSTSAVRKSVSGTAPARLSIVSAHLRNYPPRSVGTSGNPGRFRTTVHVIAATAETNRPPLDLVIAGSVAYLLHHRGVTHSLILLPLWAAGAAALLPLAAEAAKYIGPLSDELRNKFNQVIGTLHRCIYPKRPKP